MHTRALHRAVIAAALLALGTSAQAVTTVGSLSNFDAVNDTGGETEGFEIEIEGVHSSDVQYTFGGPYNRYGDPSKIDTATGVIVRWSAAWDGSKYSTATPVAVAGINPGGHDCYNGGPIGNYLTSGCEHFGIGLAVAQGNTTYRWLVADQANPGSLLAGPNVRIPAPIFHVAPPVNPAQAPVVQAVIAAPIPQNEVGGAEGSFSDAIWMKRIKTQVETDDDIQLLQLLNGNNGQLFNVETETEYEWFILQSRKGVADSGEHVMDMNPAAGKKGVAIRYEFYEFAGTYDPESHEAWCSNEANCEDLGPGGGNTDDVTVQPYLGKYVGAQMAGVNFNAAPVPEPETWALFGIGALFVAGRLRRARRHIG